MLFSRRSISEDDLEDLQGKVVIVTGGNTGIGYSTVQMLVRKGAKVYMAARNEEKARAAIVRLREEGIGEGSLHWLKLDLVDPCTAALAAEEFCRVEERLDVLVNNAARPSHGPYSLDKNGLLDVMVVNHISPFAFTHGLIPLLKKTAAETGSDVRIVNVASDAHTLVTPQSFAGKETLNKEYGPSLINCLYTYGNTKLANILHVRELQRRFDRDGTAITCISVHPGAVNTGFADGTIAELPQWMRGMARWVAPRVLTPWRDGGVNCAFAAAGSEIVASKEQWRGGYVVPVGQAGKTSKSAMDERLAQELWETTVAVLRELGESVNL